LPTSESTKGFHPYDICRGGLKEAVARKGNYNKEEMDRGESEQVVIRSSEL
jgi:hypothetical protein